MILAVASQPVLTCRQLYRALWRSGSAGRALAVSVRQNGEVREIVVESIGVESYYGHETEK